MKKGLRMKNAPGLELDEDDLLLLHHLYSVHCADIHTNIKNLTWTWSCTQSRAAVFHPGFVKRLFDVLPLEKMQN